MKATSDQALISNATWGVKTGRRTRVSFARRLTLAETLRLNGQNTSWFGKNHNLPDWQSSAAGPFDRWPTGLGFEKFYGFLGGLANNWRPALFDGTTPIEPYLGNPDYNMDFDLADQAIRWVQMQHAVAPDKPFFLYYATAAMHAPQHATPEWIARFDGQFDAGWDVVRQETYERQLAMGIIPEGTLLTPRPDAMPAWDEGTPEEQQLWTTFMEVAAANLAQADYNVGRVLDAIDDMGLGDNTMVIYIVGDNGGSGEGTLEGQFNDSTILSLTRNSLDYMIEHEAELGSWTSAPLYPVPWAWAMNAPFQWTKQVASHFGGTRNGLVISWPAGISAQGEIRSQFHHVIDIAPTILDAARLPQPVSVNGYTQRPIEGVSMMYSLDDAAAPDRRTTQYFEIFGNAGIYHDGWFASTTPQRLPWEPSGTDMDVLTGPWELYNIDEDFSQAVDLAADMPEKLREMQVRFYAEAARYNVLPIDSSAVERFGEENRPSLTGDQTSFTFRDGLTRIPEGAAPNVKNRSWTLTADIDIAAGESGVIATQGGIFGGWSLYLDDGRPVFSSTFGDGTNFRFESETALPEGPQTLVMDFAYDGDGMGKGGVATVRVGDTVYGTGRVEITTPLRFSTEETLDFGSDTGTPVDRSYDVPFDFTGELKRIVIDLR